jgi:hypothetical protein
MACLFLWLSKVKIFLSADVQTKKATLGEAYFSECSSKGKKSLWVGKAPDQKI